MRVDFHHQGIENDQSVREHAERRLHFALSRFGPRLSRVTVFLADVNGPRGGVDKRCRLVAKLTRSGSLVIEDSDADLMVLLDRASDRLARTVQRELDRRRLDGAPKASV